MWLTGPETSEVRLEKAEPVSVLRVDVNACELRRDIPRIPALAMISSSLVTSPNFDNGNSTNAQKCPLPTLTEQHGFPCPSRIHKESEVFREVNNHSAYPAFFLR